MTAEFSEVIRKIKIPSISEKKKQELLEIHRLWGHYGWTINPCADEETLFSSMPANKKDADIMALKQCPNKIMEQIFEVLLENKRRKRQILEKQYLIIDISSINHVRLFVCFN